MREIKTKLLIADDEELIANTLTIILANAGFDAHTVYSGEKAVDIARRFKPDMLIADVVMGASRESRQRFKFAHFCLRAIFCSSLGRHPPETCSKKRHAEGYEFEIFREPVHPTDMLARLRTDDVPI